MERKNILIFWFLFTSFLGLILIYIAAINLQPINIGINQITSELIGRMVLTSGKISQKTPNPSGHLFLVISDDKSSIQVPIFVSLMNDLKKNNVTENDFKVNKQISVNGLVGEYKGQLQIVPRKVSDIKLK
jgi:DNA/RNA endonuclease YhcR with UshA esterase domain